MGNAAALVHRLNRLARKPPQSIGWLVFLLSLMVTGVADAQDIPSPPDVATIEKFCKVAPGSFSLRTITPETESKLKGRMFWMASYIPKDQMKLPLALTIFLVEPGNLSALLTTRVSQPGRTSLELENGDVIYEIPGLPNDPWYNYTTLLNLRGKPYDVMIYIARPHNIPDSEIPVDIETAGSQLIQKLFEPGTP